LKTSIHKQVAWEHIVVWWKSILYHS